MEYNKKLVRDKIPQRIRANNGVPIMHIADDEEYWERLREKLKEEVNEFLKDSNPEELADILEVIFSICEFKQIDKKELELIRIKKSKERGSFKKKIILDRVD